MTATKRSPNCNDCDCCLIYESDFCDQLVTAGSSLSYLGEEWDDESGGGNIWQILTTDAGCVSLGCPDINKPFAKGVSSAVFSGRRALFRQSLPDRYHSFFDVDLFYDSSLPTTNYNIGLEVIVDYVDADNWHAVRIKFDYDHSTGYAIVFEYVKNTAGTETALGSNYSTLPSGVTNWRGAVEVAILDCDNGDRVIYVNVPSVVNRLVKITPHNGDQMAMSTVYSLYAGATTFDCGGVVSSVPQHVRVHSVTIKRSVEDRAGCESFTTNCGCECWTPEEYDVSISGVVNTDDCETCIDLNDTFTLTKIDTSDSKATFDPCTVSGCLWAYEAGDYSAISCDVQRIELFRCGDDWKLLFLYDIGAGYELIGYFILADQDCIVTNLNLGSNTNGCWYTTTGFFCPSNLCDVGSISVSITNS